MKWSCPISEGFPHRLTDHDMPYYMPLFMQYQIGIAAAGRGAQHRAGTSNDRQEVTNKDLHNLRHKYAPGMSQTREDTEGGCRDTDAGTRVFGLG